MSTIALCPIKPSQRVQVDSSDDQLVLVVSEPAGHGENRILAWIPAAKSREGVNALLEEAQRWAEISPATNGRLQMQVDPIRSRKQVSYCAIPSDTIYRYCPETDPKSGVSLNPRYDI